MVALRRLSTSFVLALGLCLPRGAMACGDPSDRWYAKVSDVVFDGVARCDATERTCRIRVTRIIKNPLNLAIEYQPIIVDFQNWYAEQAQSNPNEIIMICGVPLFEPEDERFRARFYADLDEESAELIVRTHRRRAIDRDAIQPEPES